MDQTPEGNPDDSPRGAPNSSSTRPRSTEEFGAKHNTTAMRDQEREKYMSKPFAVKESPTAWESPPVKPLDEAVWQAWKAKGRAQDKQCREARMKALKWGSMVGLLAVAALWSQLITQLRQCSVFRATGSARSSSRALSRLSYITRLARSEGGPP